LHYLSYDKKIAVDAADGAEFLNKMIKKSG
jgi:hypothetical protein